MPDEEDLNNEFCLDCCDELDDDQDLCETIDSSSCVPSAFESMNALRENILKNPTFDALRDTANNVDRIAGEYQSPIPVGGFYSIPQLFIPQSTAFSPAIELFSSVTSSLVKPEIFENLKCFSISVAEMIPSLRDSLRELTKSMRSALENWTYLHRLRDSGWPLYLVDNGELSTAVIELEYSEDDDLYEAITKLAYKHLDEDWVEAVRSGWSDLDDLSDGELRLLNTALDYHLRGEYYASVTVLMCMSSGLIEKYAGKKESLEGEDLDLFNELAPEFGVNPLNEQGRRGRNGLNTKDLMVLLVMQVDTGSYIWSLACSYVVETVFANSKPTDEPNDCHPRRNKICHGAQTDFGTLEHSLKAILAVDIIIRLGRVIKACCDETEDAQTSEQN